MDNDRVRQWATPVFFVLAVLLIALASYTAGWFKGRKTGREVGYRAGYEAGWNAPHPGDTIERRDTLYIDRPVPVYTTIERPVYLPVTDTMLVAVHDTLFVALERTARGYKGEDYEAQVSGIDPALDWVRVYPKTITITPPTPPAAKAPRIGLGASVGPGAVWNPRDGVNWGIGATAGLYVRF